MADKDQSKQSLLNTLPPQARSQAMALLDQARDSDMRDLVAELHRRGVLDTTQLRDAMLTVETVRPVEAEDAMPSKVTDPEILGPLGAGAMGEVLMAKDALGRVIAIKRLLPNMAKRTGAVRRFFKEAQITAQLDHPSIVPIYGMLDSNGSLAYTMKLVKGDTLEDYIQRAADQWSKGSIAENHALPARLERFLHACDAVAYAHDKGVVHRDLKPENIMVGAFNQVIVMDWGIAKIVGGPMEELLGDDAEVAGQKAHQTKVGMLMGTPRYMSPEQAAGANDVLDARSDQYALGVILQELVTLRPALEPDLGLGECLAWARRARRVPPTVLHRAQPLPRPLLAIIDRACAGEPEDRYPDVGAMAEDIRRFLRDDPVSTYRETPSEKLGRWVNHNRGKVFGMALAGAILAVGAVGATGMAGLTALWGAQYAAEQDAQRHKTVINEVNTHAMGLDAAFQGWNGQLNALAYSAEKALSGLSSGVTVDWDLDAAPPDLRPSDRYNRAVDLNWPDVASVSRRPRPALEALVALGPTFRATVSDSGGLLGSGRPGAQRNAIEAGVPLIWSRLYTVGGVMASFPGTSRYRSDLDDFRGEDWFTTGKNERRITWTQPRLDPRGMGIVVSAQRTLANEEGDFLGVAVIDLSLQAVVDEHLDRKPWVQRYIVLDDQGRYVVSSDDTPSKATKLPEPTLAPRLMEAARAGVPGSEHMVLDDTSMLAAWAPLSATGWMLVVLVPDDATVLP